MSDLNMDDQILEAYIYETAQMIEQLELLMIASEKDGEFSNASINEIFRLMHTIKGSSAMMMYNNISSLSHRLEDVFFLIRADETIEYDFKILIDLILESIDFFKIELHKIKSGEIPDGNNNDIYEKLSDYLEDVKKDSQDITNEQSILKKDVAKQKYYIGSSNKKEAANCYKARIWFKKDSEMENIRAYTIIHNIANMVDQVIHMPKHIIEDDNAAEEIKLNGFLLACRTTKDSEQIKNYLENTIFLEKLNFEEISFDDYQEILDVYETQETTEEIKIPKNAAKYIEKNEAATSLNQNIISVNVDKLDKLMDMIGELVIAEAMVTRNQEINNLEIESFDKASRQLHKITGELQDMVMAIRMVPLSTTFLKMHRLVRDMTRKLGKDVVLELYGDETEVDKNIIETIADPLMHIIRNAVDHGIEMAADRINSGKNKQGTIILEAKNSGRDVLIKIRDDGKGLDKKKIYEKASFLNLVNRPYEDMSDREIYNLILLPGFSMKNEVTEFSGRGVGMDVVTKNIQNIGGAVIIDSILGSGTTITLKIPLTLAIVEGMNLKVGESRFTIPIETIKETFRTHRSEIISDLDGHEMIMVRGLCYPILRIHELYKIPTDIKDIEDGILIMVEDNDRSGCIFADELLGQQQVVVKTLPNYIQKYKQIKGLGGCTLLGDGSISLILNVSEYELSNVNEKHTNK